MNSMFALFSRKLPATAWALLAVVAPAAAQAAGEAPQPVAGAAATPMAIATAAPEAVPDSAAPVVVDTTTGGLSGALPVGEATRALLAAQRAASGPDRPIPGDEAGRSYARYLKSFEFPIPERYETSVSDAVRGGAGGAN